MSDFATTILRATCHGVGQVLPCAARSAIRLALFSGLACACAGSGDIQERLQGPIHYVESGERTPAVVFIPGLTQSSVYWEDWVKLLGRCGFHALAVDLPGFGGSSRAPGPYTLEGLADAVAKLIQVRHLDPVTLVGGSMGSTVAQFVALNHPAVVQRLVLVATSSHAFEPPPGGAAPAPKLTQAQSIEITKKRWRQNPTAIVNGFFYAGKPPAGYAERFYAAFQQMNLDAGARIAESNNHWSTYERLGELAVPTLIIQGAHDRSKSPEEGVRMAERMPNARLVVLEEAAHSPQWDAPWAFNAAVLPFIMEGEPKGSRCVASSSFPQN